MWWWRLIVFAEFARRRRHLFLLALENPYSDYLQFFAVCILALGNLSVITRFLRFPEGFFLLYAVAILSLVLVRET